jgi:hypothetical protein
MRVAARHIEPSGVRVFRTLAPCILLFINGCRGDQESRYESLGRALLTYEWAVAEGRQGRHRSQLKIARELDQDYPGWRVHFRRAFFTAGVANAPRAWVGLVLAAAEDRPTYERLLAGLEKNEFRAPIPAAMMIVAWNASRQDVPRIIALLSRDSPHTRMIAAWSLFHITGIYFGSPDRGIRGQNLHDRWSRWWRANGAKTKTAWIKEGMQIYLNDLKSESPSRRARAALLARAVASELATGAFMWPAEREPWETWWSEAGGRIAVDEGWRAGRKSFGSPLQAVHHEVFDNILFVSEENMEWNYLRALERLIYRELPADPMNDDLIVERIEELTDVEFKVPFPEPEVSPDATMIPAEVMDYGEKKWQYWKDKWQEWHRLNGDNLRWDWEQGHFVVTAGGRDADESRERKGPSEEGTDGD